MTDLGPVRYEPPLTRSGVWPPGQHNVALPTGPRWMRGASRWHRIRSGIQHRTFAAHTSYHAWCGQILYPDKARGMTDELPADGAPLCGTCEGRAAGAGHPSPLSGPQLLFSPMRLKPPRWCPGGAPKGHLAEESLRREIGRNVVRCVVCGEVTRLKRMAWTEWRVMPAQHEAGPGLVPGCPEHAWNHLAWRGEVYCGCGRRLYWPG